MLMCGILRHSKTEQPKARALFDEWWMDYRMEDIYEPVTPRSDMYCVRSRKDIAKAAFIAGLQKCQE
jgi:hypothetical protein